MKEEEAQKMYFEFLQLQEQAEQLQQHIQTMQEQVRSINQTKHTVKQLQELKQPVESWMQIAPGAFVKATAKPVDSILLNIGSGAAVEKTPEQVLQTLEEHSKTLDELTSAAYKELEEIVAKIESIKDNVEKQQEEK